MPIEFIIHRHKIIYIPVTKNITSIHAHVKVNSIWEPIKLSGIAHLLEHVLLDSWAKCKGSCTKYWSKKGILSNGYTKPWSTEYFVIGMNDSEDMYDYMGSVMTKPYWSSKCLETAKQAVKDELLVQINNPQWKIEDVFYKSISSRIADYKLKINNLDTITLQDLQDYYNQWYCTGNIFFVIVTNSPISLVKRYLLKYLHPRPDAITSKPDYLNVKVHDQILHRKDAKKTTYSIGFVYNKPSQEDVLYYNIIKDMLVGDVFSLLYKTLRDNLKLIYGIHLNFEITKDSILSTFNMTCQFQNSEKLYKKFIEILQNFIVGKYDDYLLERTKERLTIMDTNSCKENTEYLSSFYSNQYILTDSLSVTPDMAIRIIQKVSKKKIITLSKKLFDFQNIIVVCETK